MSNENLGKQWIAEIIGDVKKRRDDMQNHLSRLKNEGHYKQAHVDALALLNAMLSAAAPQVVAKLPKWIDDKKGSDPLVDDLIAYIEQNVAPQVAADERAAFEKMEPGLKLERLSDESYKNDFVQCAWRGWQARAALAAVPVQAQEPVSDTTLINSFMLPADHAHLTLVAAARSLPVQPVAVPDGTLLASVTALAHKWNADAVKDGFAASDAGMELLEILGWPVAAPAAQGDADTGLAKIVIQNIVRPYSPVEMAFFYMADGHHKDRIGEVLQEFRAAIAAKAAS